MSAFERTLKQHPVSYRIVPNMRRKYATAAWNQLPHLVPQASGHMDSAILLAAMSR